MRLRLKSFLPFFVILLALAGFMLLRMTRPEPPPAGEEERRWPIAITHLQSGTYAPQVRLFGQLHSPTDATLKARTPGDVVALAVQSGQAVAAGDPLLRLSDQEAQALYQQRLAEEAEVRSQQEQLERQQAMNRQALAEEQALVRLSERQYQRIRQLFEAGRAAQRELDEAQSALSQQRLALMNRELALAQYASQKQQLDEAEERATRQLQLARRDLNATDLKAPADLWVQTVHVGLGDQVTTGTPLLRVFRPDQLEMRARLPVTLMPRLRPALEAGETLLATAEVEGRSLVFALQTLAARTDTTAGIEAVFKHQSGDAAGLALGHFVDARLSLPVAEKSFWLPAAAVQGRNRIYRVVDQRLEGLDVTLLGELEREGQPGILVRAPELQTGDKILATRLPNAMQGLLVDVVEVVDAQ